MPRRRRKRATKKVPICYDDGVKHIEYVSKAKKELLPELLRIRSEILQALRLLNYLRRKRHSVLISVRFQLQESLRDIPEDAEPAELAEEIARLSFIMDNALNQLNILSHSRTPLIEQIRFKLTYGQTPKKRDPAGSYGARLLDDVDEEETNEQAKE
jgi:hypothetical protein